MITAKQARDITNSSILDTYNNIRRVDTLDRTCEEIQERCRLGYYKLETIVHPDDEKWLKKELNKLGYRVLAGTIMFNIYWNKTWWDKLKEYFVKT